MIRNYLAAMVCVLLAGSFLGAQEPRRVDLNGDTPLVTYLPQATAMLSSERVTAGRRGLSNPLARRGHAF